MASIDEAILMIRQNASAELATRSEFVEKLFEASFDYVEENQIEYVTIQDLSHIVANLHSNEGGIDKVASLLGKAFSMIIVTHHEKGYLQPSRLTASVYLDLLRGIIGKLTLHHSFFEKSIHFAFCFRYYANVS